MTAGIYIHIPFCVQKCAYCDFFSEDLGGEFFLGKKPPLSKNLHLYADKLCGDLKSAREAFASPSACDAADFAGVEIDTVYIGGGTPTALPAFLLCGILDAVRGLPLLPDAEITVEVNPGTVDAAYLAAIRAGGVNRLSVGAQTTHSHLLRALGRIHTREEFFECFRDARAVGFDNINVDLMFALPGQTLAEWREDLDEIVALSPEHISAYSLTPAENTPLYERLKRGEIVLPDDETDRNMYHHARARLADAGFSHYEISNFARPGRESRHNVNCWTMRPYFGFGAGAHSFDGTARWSNPENITAHRNEGFFGEVCPDGAGVVNGRPDGETFSSKKISPPEVLTQEKIILGLRMMRGVREDEFSAIYGEEIAGLIRDGLLAREDGRVFLTARGMDLANLVFEAFL
ncbi:MAG: radical SAM family heme chaperone HemW [Defluviitaleaceae bacterium]|nr:radical SAM family heme chaperone HemW [Defluviitaleaceae bacterium]